MSASNKILQAAAGNAGGESVYVDDVFSTYLYTGNGSTQTITNGIDLSGEGGLVWTKPRDSVGGTFPFNDHILVDSERGNFFLKSNSTDANNSIASFNFSETGYTVPNNLRVIQSGIDYVSWTFRKQAGFFDVVTWTGTGSTNHINHNLGSTPGFIITKRTDSSEDWYVSGGGSTFYHFYSGFATNAANESNVSETSTNLNSATFNAARFSNNTSGGTYVAYLFAHDDQSFGDNSDESIIKCGSYTGNGSSQDINLGFEPQWLMIKKSSAAGSWQIIDTMRGMPVDAGSTKYLLADSSGAEYGSGAEYQAQPTATGFKLGLSNDVNQSGVTFIYIAIRRPMKTPESGTDVFMPNDVDNGASKPDSLSNFPVDMYFRRYVNTTNDTYLLTRLTSPNALKTNGTDAEAAFSTASAGFDYNDGVMNTFSSDNSDFHTWMFRRATGFFDVVAYTGNGTAGTTYSHNLGVVPEFMIVKNRSLSEHWPTYHVGMNGGATPQNYNMVLSATTAEGADSDIWNNTAPTSSVFTVGGNDKVNRSGAYYIAYLFATLDGVSKVGSYTGTGSALTVDCGFSSGARFIMIKRTDAAAGWIVFDSKRGIVAGADPYIYLNSTDAESSTDAIDPDSSGFIVNPVGGALNTSGGEYIFLAIA